MAAREPLSRRYTLRNVTRWCNSRTPGLYVQELANLIEDMGLATQLQYAELAYRAQRPNLPDQLTDNQWAAFACQFLNTQLNSWASAQSVMTELQAAMVVALAAPEPPQLTAQTRTGPNVALLRHNSYGVPYTLERVPIQEASDIYLFQNYDEVQLDNTPIVRSEMTRRLVQAEVIPASLSRRVTSAQLRAAFKSYVDSTVCVSPRSVPMLQWDIAHIDRLSPVILPVISTNADDLIRDLANAEQVIVRSDALGSSDIVIFYPELSAPFNFMSYSIPPNGLTVAQLVYNILHHYIEHADVSSDELDDMSLQVIEQCPNGFFTPVLTSSAAQEDDDEAYE